MKPIHIIIGLLFFSLSITSYAQISVFDIVEDAKKERGDATDAAEEDASNKKRSSGEEFDMRGMMNLIRNSNIGNGFYEYQGETVTAEANCLRIIGDHVEGLFQVQQQIEAEGDCKKKKELLEYQALLLLTAGTKFFCPDEFNSDKVFYAKSIYEIIDGNSPDRVIINDALIKIQNASIVFGNPYSDNNVPEMKEKQLNENFIDMITYFLSPEFMAKRATQISEMRENLPCN